MDSNDPEIPDFGQIYAPRPRVNLQGRKIRVVGLADPDYAYYLTLKNASDGSLVFNTGYTLDILLLLQYALNFTHIPIIGLGWPDLLENGSWVGLARQILDDEAEFSIAQSTLLMNKIKVFDYLYPTSRGILAASFRQPPSNSVRNILTASFPLSLWAMLGVFALIFVGSIKLMWFGRAWLCGADKREDEGLAEDAGYWILVTYCQRNTDKSPESLYMRIIYLSLTILCILGYVVFSAALVSTLSVELLPIQSFPDLVHSTLSIYGDVSIPFTHEFIQNIVNQRLQDSGKRELSNLDPTYYLSVKDGVRKITSGSGMFITFEDALNSAYQELNLGDDYICSNIFKLPVPETRMVGGMMVKKGSGLRPILNPKMAMLHERGLIRRAYSRWYEALFPRCLRAVGSSAGEPLSLNDVVTAFVLLVIGGLLAFVAAGGELIYALTMLRNKCFCRPFNDCCFCRCNQRE